MSAARDALANVRVAATFLAAARVGGADYRQAARNLCVAQIKAIEAGATVHDVTEASEGY